MSGNRCKILIVEDEARIRSVLCTLLETNGYQAIYAETCRCGITMFCSHRPDLVLLDLGLPDRDGQEFLSEVRKLSSVPIIVLSARTHEQDKVEALDLGANDYITKPFGTAELLARVRAALRNRRFNGDDDRPPKKIFELDDLRIDYERRRVTVAGREIALTQTEYSILCTLSQHPGKVLTYASIIRAVWQFSDPGSVKKLQVNMANIRRKLGARPGENRYIQNELGVGYRMLDE